MKPARCRSYTFTRGEIMGAEMDGEEESKPKKDTKEYFDPEWIDGEFD